VTDLERFFRRLVANLASSDPAMLHRPIPLEDIHQSIIPYRTNRRALHLESSEDYEMVLLRLCAGEGGLVRTEPEEARDRFEEELKSPNPDLGVLHRVEHVLISLRSEPLERALRPDADAALAYAPPAPMPPELAGLDPALDGPVGVTLDDELTGLESEPEPTVEDQASQCLYCGGSLPLDRPARFCPHCGQRQSPPECPRCHHEVETGWRHCVNCGAALAET
jgi:hypothetical protein